MDSGLLAVRSNMSEWIITPKLRWVTGVDYHETGYDTFTTKRTRKLQQWWMDPHNHPEGEWRDVPEEEGE